MNHSAIDYLFEQFEQLKILVVGDIMIDSYVWGSVDRISPEAPVPIISVKNKENRLGGAANVALNLQSLGATPIMCSVIGDDVSAQHFLSLCQNNNLNTEGIIKSNQRITTVKERIMSGSQHIVRIDHEIDVNLDSKSRQLLINKFEVLIKKVDAIVFQDYDKGVLDKEIIEEMLSIAHHNNKPTIVDPKKRNFLCYKGATLFKPNLKELKEGLKVDFDGADMHSVAVAVSRLKMALKVKNALLTLSENGIYIDGEKEKTHIKAHIRKIADVSGAGDTVVSIASLCVALHQSAEVIASLSNLGGGIVCEQLGVVPVDKLKLKNEAQHYGLLPN
jgi:D-glycero-beta-D-manno-heptose-7-phosphate kinase